MQKAIFILLLFFSTICHGQEKYSVMKTYRYNGDDSTKAELIRTDSFNDKGKVVLSIERRLLDDKGIGYIDYEKNEYTYNDTFLISEMTVRKAEQKKGNQYYYDSYIGGDSEKIVHSYKLDSKNRITEHKEVHSRKDYEYANGNWAISGELLDENIYDDRYGLVKESRSSKRGKDTVFTLLRWSVLSYDAIYDKPKPKSIQYRLAQREYYSGIAQHPLTHIYQYSQDTVKIFDFSPEQLTHSFFEGDTTTTVNIPGCETFIYNKKKELIIKSRWQRSGQKYYHSNDYYYFYDNYGRKTKEIIFFYGNTITTLYTYE